jgi:hypothetical protein
MATITFDTHTAIEYLIKSGIKKPHAEALVKTMQQSRELDISTLVTKDYLDAKISQLKFEMIKWIIGIAVVGFSGITGTIIAVLKFYLDKSVG